MLAHMMHLPMSISTIRRSQIISMALLTKNKKKNLSSHKKANECIDAKRIATNLKVRTKKIQPLPIVWRKAITLFKLMSISHYCPTKRTA